MLTRHLMFENISPASVKKGDIVKRIQGRKVKEADDVKELIWTAAHSEGFL